MAPDRAAQPPDRPWLTISEAADYLGVHPTTLRRWADNGEIPVLLTPGGHRRFALEDLQRFAEDRRRLRALAGLERLWADQALTVTRREIVRQEAAPWLVAFDETTRQEKRQLGRRLLGVMLQYVSRSEGGEALLAEARQIGRAYGDQAREQGLPLRLALQAAMFFRDAVVEAAVMLPESAHLQPGANASLLRRLTPVLNEVQLAIVEAYEEAEA